MRFRIKSVKAGGDTLALTVVIERPGPIPTRTKFRRRRFLRIVRTAAFEAARGHIDKPLSPATHSSLTQQVIQVCRDTAKRYAHLRT